MSKRSWRFYCLPFIVLLVFVSVAVPGSAQPRPPSPAATPSQADSLKALQWRSIGPFRGGRSAAVAGVASQPMVYYFGGTGGGVWKTTDGGINWEPISDGSVFGTGSVGAIGLSDSDPNTIYVGMGESPIRGNVSHGDGVYKSTDAGKTWKRVGLEDTRQITRIRVHPKNPDIVYRGGARACLGTERAARHFSIERWRQDLAEGPFSRQQSRGQRFDHRSDQPECALCRILGSLSQTLDSGERRPRRRHLQIN